MILIILEGLGRRMNWIFEAMNMDNLKVVKSEKTHTNAIFDVHLPQD